MSAGVEKNITEFTIQGYSDSAFVSLNSQQVVKCEIENGNTLQTVKLDSTQPFATVLLTNIGSITFFDAHGNVIKTINQPL